MFPYEKLEVYQKGKAVHSLVLKLIRSNKDIPAYMKSQLGRAALSIPLNIAEGSSRFSKKDRRNFFITARGSAFECASIIEILGEEEIVDVPICISLKEKFDEISRILFVMIQNLGKDSSREKGK